MLQTYQSASERSYQSDSDPDPIRRSDASSNPNKEFYNTIRRRSTMMANSAQGGVGLIYGDEMDYKVRDTFKFNKTQSR